MSLKGKIIYFVIPFFCYVLAKMIHPVFFVLIIIYFLYCFKCLSIKEIIWIALFFIISLLIFRIPEIKPIQSIEGKVVGVGNDYIIVQDGYEKAKVYGKFNNVNIDDQIALTGNELEPSLPANDHAFHYQHYLYSLNVFHTLKLTQMIDHQKNHGPFFILQKRVQQNKEISCLVSLFVLGTKDESMKEFYDKLTELSMVHLFALSGMHLNILNQWLHQLLKFFFTKKYQNIISMIIIGFYLSIIPYNISFLRAYLMMLLPMFFHRYFHQLDIFLLLSMFMLIYNPYLIYNLSFIFSYLIYFFILLFQNNKKMKYLLFIASIPIILCVNNGINLLSLMLSVCFVPFVEIIYRSILYYLLLGKCMVPFLSVLYHCFEMMIHFLYHKTFYLHFSSPNLFFIFIYYLMFFKIILKVNMNRKYQKEVSCLLGLLLAFYFYPYYNIQGKVVMINVGQGDCFLIKQPLSMGNVLIDTGGLKNRDVAQDIIIPYLYSEGIKKLDAVFISHDDFDHCGALDSLIHHFPVGKVIHDFQTIKIGKLTFRNLALDKAYDDENDRSLIIHVKINHLYYLFTGDISENVEHDLYLKYKELKVDVLKVSHHGSQSATSDELFKLIKPKIAFISVGKNNLYRHPHREVIQRLEDEGVHIYRSDLTGMVSIVYYGKDNYIYQ